MQKVSKLLQTSRTYPLNSTEQMPNSPFCIIHFFYDNIPINIAPWTRYSAVRFQCNLRFLKNVRLPLSATERLRYKQQSDCFTQSLDPQRSLGSLAVAGMGKMIQPLAPIRWLRVQLDHSLSVCACVCVKLPTVCSEQVNRQSK